MTTGKSWDSGRVWWAAAALAACVAWADPGLAAQASGEAAPAPAAREGEARDGDEAGATTPNPATEQALPSEDDARARRLLARAESAYASLSSLTALFDQTIEVPLLGRRREGTGVWYQKAPARFRMEFHQPEGDLIVADGRHVWLYYPSTHPGQVIRSAIDARSAGAGMVDLQGRIFAEARRYVAAFGGSEVVAGSPTYRIDLTPTGDSPYLRVRVWLDAESLLVRKFEITERNETVRTVVLRDLRPEAPVPNDLFWFSPPPGTDVFEG